MKKIIILALLGFMSFNYAQVIIGDKVGTATDKTSVLLEFSKTENKGIVLPYVTQLPTNPAEGTIALDATNGTTAKVVYYNGTWVDLSSGETADISSALQIQNNQNEAADAKAIIGSNSSTADGVLVLESTNKAMVLPQVTNTNDIINPAPGMMVYVKSDKLLAVFNGSKWTFWKAEN